MLRSLEKEPERRYQQASEVKTDVDAIVQSGAQSKPLRPTGQTDWVTLKPRMLPQDATDLLMWLVHWLITGGIFFLFVSALLGSFIFVPFVLGSFSGVPGHKILRDFSVVLILPGIGAVVFIVVMYGTRLSRSIRSMTVDARGLTMNRNVQPSPFLAWDEGFGRSAC